MIRSSRPLPRRQSQIAASLALALATAAGPAVAQQVPAPSPTPYARAVAAGYKAAIYCAGIFTSGRTPTQIDADELSGIYPDYDAIVPTLTARVDRAAHSVDVPFAAGIEPRHAIWESGAGCRLLPIGGRGAASIPDVIEDRPSPAAFPIGPRPADPRPWPMGDAGIAPKPSPALAGRVAAAFDAQSYGAGNKTVGVLVLRDGKVVAERYRDGFGPFVANRTWSVGKSIMGTLAGLARLDPQAPAAIANWRAPLDPRAAITNDQLMRMASGLHSDTAGNRTDAIYFGGTAVDEQAPGWPLEVAPGSRFRYANNDILLAMMSLRARIGDQRYADFPATALFAPLGMAHTIAERDWRGNYVISSQVWSTARDVARLGQFWLQDGVWQGKRLLPEGWLRYMTTPSGPQPGGDGPGYGATMWLFGAKQGLPAGSYAAQGNRGQYIMVVPSARIVVVRRGEDGGSARFDIARFTADVLAALP